MRLSTLFEEIKSVSAMRLWKLKCFKHTLVVGVVTPRQAQACRCCALAPVRKCAYFLFPCLATLWWHVFVRTLCIT